MRHSQSKNGLDRERSGAGGCRHDYSGIARSAHQFPSNIIMQLLLSALLVLPLLCALGPYV